MAKHKEENTLAEAKSKNAILATEIVHTGEKLTLPTGVTLEQGIELLQRRIQYESQKTVVFEVFDAFPLDGAVQLDTVLNRLYGWAPAAAIPGFFGDNPPALISVEIGFGKVRQVPWGRFLLPNVAGFIQTSVQGKEGRYCFSIQSECLRRDEPVVRRLFEEVRKEIAGNSIYRGQAVRINFLDDNDEPIPMPQPKFLDTDSVDDNKLVLSDHLMRAVQTNLFTPITRTLDCIANGIAVKRGVLLGGTFGTGKTMIAHVASKYAVQSGITFLYIKKATELALAIEFARQYQSPACVIFCEDIDREVTGERTEEMDAVLNTIDGIDSKTSNIIVVLTTNDIKGIHPAMLRPGRLDAVIDVTAPDGGAIQRLIKVYAAGALDPDADLTEVGETLAGNIPAVIAEVVKRAKLSQLSLQDRGTKVTKLTAAALLDSAKTIQAQVLLLNPAAAAPAPALDQALADVVRRAFNGNHEAIQDIERRTREIHEHIL